MEAKAPLQAAPSGDGWKSGLRFEFHLSRFVSMICKRRKVLHSAAREASKQSEAARTWLIKSSQPGAGGRPIVQHNAADGSFRSYKLDTNEEVDSGKWTLDGETYSETSLRHKYNMRGALRRDSGGAVWIQASSEDGEYTYLPRSERYVLGHRAASLDAKQVQHFQQREEVADWRPVAVWLWQTKLSEHIFSQLGLRFDEDGNGTQTFLDLNDVWRKTGESRCDGWRRITFDRTLLCGDQVVDTGTAVAHVLDSGHVIAFFSMNPPNNSQGYCIFSTAQPLVEVQESVAGRWEAFLVDEWFSTIPSSSRSSCVLELDEDGAGRCVLDGVGYTLRPRACPGHVDSGWFRPGPGQVTSVMESHVELPGGYTVSVEEDFFKLGCGAPGILFMKTINKPEAMLFRRAQPQQGQLPLLAAMLFRRQTAAQPQQGQLPLLAARTQAKLDVITWHVGELSAESLIGGVAIGTPVDLFDMHGGDGAGSKVVYLKSGVGKIGNSWWVEVQRAAEKRLVAATAIERVWSLLVLATVAARCGDEAVALTAVDGLCACANDETLPLRSDALAFLRWLAESPELAAAGPAPIPAGLRAGGTPKAGVEVRVPHPLDVRCDNPQCALVPAVRVAAREALERVARPVSGNLDFRVLFMSNGSRGDVQPAVTLAKNLQARGCIVKALTRVGISDFCKDEGVEAVPFAADLSEVFRSMGGISQHTFHEIGHHEGQWALKHPGVLHDPTAIMDDFKPDVILWTAGERHDVAFRYEQEHGVPAIPLLALGVNSLPPHYREAFQCFPSRPGFVTTSPLTEKDAKLDGLHRCHQTGFWSPEHDPTPEELAKKPLASLVAFLANGPPPVVVNWGSLLARGVSLEAMLLRPVLAAQLAGCRLVVLGGYARLHELGEVLEKEGGEALLRAACASHKVEDPAKTGPDINEVMARLSKGEDPGIDNDKLNQILAKLSTVGSFLAPAVDVDDTDVIEAVEDEEKRKSLEDFARTHCCFVPSAPHKWLFPQCACVVHHGGAGTTHAAMTAGRPSIVTPIAFDQFYWASVVEDLGVGVHLGGSEGLAAVRVPELAEAMREADRATACAEELGRSLRAEPGVAAAADVLCKFLQDEVGTGGWRRRWEATLYEDKQWLRPMVLSSSSSAS